MSQKKKKMKKQLKKTAIMDFWATVQWAPLSSDGRLGHLLIHMQLESRALGYWIVHNVVPPIQLQIPLAPWVLSLAPPLGAL